MFSMNVTLDLKRRLTSHREETQTNLTSLQGLQLRPIAT